MLDYIDTSLSIVDYPKVYFWRGVLWEIADSFDALPKFRHNIRRLRGAYEMGGRIWDGKLRDNCPNIF